MNFLNKALLTRISQSEAHALLAAHNCIREAWSDCDVWIAHEGALQKKIVLRELKTDGWFKPNKV